MGAFSAGEMGRERSSSSISLCLGGIGALDGVCGFLSLPQMKEYVVWISVDIFQCIHTLYVYIYI